MKGFFTIVLLLLAFTLTAQVYQTGYYHAQEDYAERIFQHPDGSYVLVGTGHDSTEFYFGPWRMQIGQNGESIAQSQYILPSSLTNLTEPLEEAIVDASGHLVMVMYSGAVLQVDAAGNVNWAQRCSGMDPVNWLDLHEMPSGNYALAGQADGDLLLIVMTPQGSLLWQKSYGIPGSSWETNAQIAALDDGGFALHGSTMNGAALVRLDSSGAVQWAREYPDLGWMPELIPAANGSVVAGFVQFNGPGFFSGLLKIDAAGNLNWAHRYETPMGMKLGAVTETRDGGFILAAEVQAALIRNHFFRVDSAGSLLWNRYQGFEGLSLISSILETGSGDFIYTGAGSSGVFSDFDAEAIRLASDGRGFCYEDTVTFVDNGSFAVLETPLLVQAQTATSTCNSVAFNQAASPLTDTLICQTPLGRPAPEEDQIKVFPNPSQGYFRIQIPAGLAGSTAELWDLQGRYLLAVEIGADGAAEVNASALPPGMYVVRTNFPTGFRSKLIQIQR